MSNPQHHQSARRALRLQWILQGHAFDGLRLKQIAEALGVTSPMALRDLQLLADEGIASISLNPDSVIATWQQLAG